MSSYLRAAAVGDEERVVGAGFLAEFGAPPNLPNTDTMLATLPLPM